MKSKTNIVLAHAAFEGNADPAQAGAIAVNQRLLSIKSFSAKAGPPAWQYIRSWYLICSNNQMIPAPAEEIMPKRMGATVRSISSSHASMVRHPREVVDIIAPAADLGATSKVAA